MRNPFGKTPRGATPRPDPHLPPRPAVAIPNWLWLLFVLLAGASLGALLYLWQPWQPAKRPDLPSADTSAAVEPSKNAKGDYEFYDLLPKQQVTPVPQQEVPPQASALERPEPAPRVATPPVIPRSTGSSESSDTTTLSVSETIERQPVYILQINSYTNPDDADRQRAEVLLTGLSADIRQTQVGDALWYRVVSGPYPSRAEAVSAQQTLQNSGIDALVVEQP